MFRWAERVHGLFQRELGRKRLARAGSERSLLWSRLSSLAIAGLILLPLRLVLAQSQTQPPLTSSELQLVRGLLRHLLVQPAASHPQGVDIVLEKANLILRNGLGATNGNPSQPDTYDPNLVVTNGLGNLIVGYTDSDKGSHNIVLGWKSRFPSVGALVGGFQNTASGPYSSVTGGLLGVASGLLSSISGGNSNQAVGALSTVSGGAGNKAVGSESSVSGGQENETDGADSAISGGYRNRVTIPTTYGSVSGGQRNSANGVLCSVTGGQFNDAGGHHATISGGNSNFTRGGFAVVSGGAGNQANGAESSVSGGEANQAIGDDSSVGGDRGKQVTARYGSASGSTPALTWIQEIETRYMDQYGLVQQIDPATGTVGPSDNDLLWTCWYYIARNLRGEWDANTLSKFQETVQQCLYNPDRPGLYVRRPGKREFTDWDDYFGLATASYICDPDARNRQGYSTLRS